MEGFWSGMGCKGLGVELKIGATIVGGLRESSVRRGAGGDPKYVIEGVGFQAMHWCICSCVWCVDLLVYLRLVVLFALCETWRRDGFSELGGFVGVRFLGVALFCECRGLCFSRLLGRGSRSGSAGFSVGGGGGLARGVVCWRWDIWYMCPWR